MFLTFRKLTFFHTFRKYCRTGLGSPVRSYHILFFGTDEFAVTCLKELMHNAKSTTQVVNKLEVLCLPYLNSPVCKFAKSQNLAVHYWPDFPDLKTFDLGIVVSFGKLLSAALINSFSYGMINVHGSLLPKLRGAAPVARAIEQGYKSTGVTILQIAPDHFDRGAILNSSEEIAISDDMNATQLTQLLEQVGARLCIDTLRDFPSKQRNAKSQSDSDATYAPKITIRDTHLDWNVLTAANVWRKYKAFGFMKSLHLRCRLPDESMEDNVAKLVEIQPCSAPELPASGSAPGSVAFHKESKKLIIACKSGAIACTKLTLPGRKPLTAVDFYNGFMQVRLKRGEKILFHSYVDRKHDNVEARSNTY